MFILISANEKEIHALVSLIYLQVINIIINHFWYKRISRINEFLLENMKNIINSREI